MWLVHKYGYHSLCHLLLEQVNIDYARTMNKLSLDEAIRRGNLGSTAPLVPLTENFPRDPPKVGR
jgi:hypothetical protein